MKNHLAILLAIVMSIQGVSFFVEELAKLPSLFAHFQEHQRGDQERDFTFSDFIAQHYGNQPHDGNSHHDHSNLPFHSHAASCSAHFFALSVPPEFAMTIAPAAPLFLRNSAFANDDFCSRLFIRDIFRPPLG